MLNYKVDGNKILIDLSPEFDVKKTLECGQLFRYKQTPDGFEVYSLNHKASINCHKGGTTIVCDDVNYFVNYFDLCTDYAKINTVLKGNKIVANALKFGEGIRILKQNNLEALICFIISQNNNIPRIQKIIEDICSYYGENLNGYYSFPSLDKLKTIPKKFFTEIKCGYRDEYLYSSIQSIANGFDLNCIYNMPADDANKYLTTLKGIGQKVADCVLLYGFYQTDVFPTDTWIVKVYNDLYDQKLTAIQIRNKFVAMFKNLSGYAQQYLFYEKRENN